MKELLTKNQGRHEDEKTQAKWGNGGRGMGMKWHLPTRCGAAFFVVVVLFLFFLVLLRWYYF